MGPRAWKRRIVALGSSLNELLRAELAALWTDLVASARRVGGASILMVVGGVLCLLALTALALTLFEVLALVLPRWAAAASITGILALIGGILIAMGRSRIRRTESPTETLRRHLQDHQDWWERDILEEGEDAGDERE